MPWIEKHPKRQHHCKKPRIRWWHQTGATWMCGECGWIWEITEHVKSVYRAWTLRDSRTQEQRSVDAARERLRKVPSPPLGPGGGSTWTP